MFFLNLSLPEFLAIAGAVSGLITVLYFFDRSKRKKTVSTLRFWTAAIGAEQQKRRKSVRQPWSLLLQLLSILLLLLAIARLQWGSWNSETRNTVLLLDTSSSAAWKSGAGAVLDREKVLAKQYLARVSARERVMLVRVDALASPATPFTTDRKLLRTEIEASVAAYSALNAGRALRYARQAMGRAAGTSGEVVYIGPEKVTEPFSGSTPGLRVLGVRSGTENCGIRAINVTRAEGEEAWLATVILRNDGRQNQVLKLSTGFGTTPFAPRRVMLRPHEEASVSYQFVANTAGRLTVRLTSANGLSTDGLSTDGLATDDEASVMLPLSRPAKVIVYSAREEAWRPLLGADKSLDVQYQPPEQYRAHPDADVVILDRFAPRSRPQIPSLWVDVPADGSPLPVKSDIAGQTITQWNTDTELGAGLHARDVLLPKAEAFQIFDKDFVVAATNKGPVAVVRPDSDAGAKLAVVGFDFISEPLRYTVTSPILFANMMRWLAPQAFRAVQVSAEPVGLANITLENSELPDEAHVTDSSGRAVPFLVESGRLQFFMEAPAIVHVITGHRERILSMVLPEIATQDWKIPAMVPQSIPGFSTGGPAAIDLWQILACLGGFGLILEWFLFGRQRSTAFRPRAAAFTTPPVSRSQRERELVSR